MNNVYKKEVDRFSATAGEWWDEEGVYETLHRINKVRLQFLIDDIGVEPKGLKVLDIGCGGGLLAEPLARLGCEVIAIDASIEAIEVAQKHAAKSGLKIDYRCELIEESVEKDFDLVLAMEIIEHVPDVKKFIKAAASKMAFNGRIIFSTINRTPEAFLLAIIGAEYILNWLPVGTHNFNQFVKVEELENALTLMGKKNIRTKGMMFNPITQNFFLSNNCRVNYFMSAGA